jgi:Tol biopolymer transport system component
MPGLHVTEIYSENANGSSLTPLTHGTPGFGQPSWSPNGTAIAFVANLPSASAIEVANADGAGAHPVSPRSWTSYSPTWTPGGKIVFLRQTRASTMYTDVSTSAYIVNADGTGLRVLYPHLNVSEIAWGHASLPAGC